MNRLPRTSLPGRDRWMVSYLDVLTILLIFFLTAAAKESKIPVPGSQSSNAQQGKPAESTETLPDSELAGVERKLKQAGLDVRDLRDSQGEHAGERGLTILLPQAVLFAPGDDRIRPEALAPLQKIAAALRDVPNKVNLEGHADATPIHNLRFRNNWELAAARSLRLMEVLTERYGIEEARVSISSYGPLVPKGSNDTTGGRALNRRVEILILGERAR